MSTDRKRDNRVPQLPTVLIKPDQFGLTDAKTIAAAFAIGAATPEPPRRAALPDIDFANVVFVRRRTFLERIRAAWRAFTADSDPFADGPLSGKAPKVVPFRRLA